MLSLPLPLVTGIIAGLAAVLVLRLPLGNRLAQRLLAAAFGAIGLSALLIGLRFGYGLGQMIVVQRALPLFIGPLFYLGFLAFALAPDEVRRAMWRHLGLALGLALAPMALPGVRPAYDIVIGASYLAYGGALLRLWWRDADRLAYAPLGRTKGLRVWMLAAAAMLMLMIVLDGIIALSFALAAPERALFWIGVGSVLSLVSVIGVAVAVSRAGGDRGSARPQSTATSDHVALEARARVLLQEQEMFLDTDLTLDRLARRLHVPARALSEAINQTQGMNVSHYVNGFRLDRAAALLLDTEMSVSQVMARSGFLTRSNFYREFERVHGTSPMGWRRTARCTPAETDSF